MPAINMSSNAGVAKFLTSHGIDLKGIVIQRGAHNYAGPSCPGVGWTCTSAKRVVQLSYKGNDSQFQCTPSTGGTATAPGTCTIIQISSGGTNEARCTERTSDASASQSCVIFQSNTTGDNHLEINQQVDAHGGSTQDATQYAGVNQANVSGKNDAHIKQDIHQDTNDSALGAQSQEGHQGVSVTQSSDTGDNKAEVQQSLAQHAEATGKVLVVNQRQDATSSGPNTNAGITQSSTSGNNTAKLDQSNDLHANASGKATGSQTQGSWTGGLNGYFNQNSTGVSTVQGSQDERQKLNPDHASSGLSQTQYGPAWFDPSQGSNPADTYNLDQKSKQDASSSAFQSDQLYAECETSGVCTANQDINQNGNHQQNSCSGDSCNIGLECTSGGEGGGCFSPTECDGPCGNPPPPPPPPFRGCEFSCDVIGIDNLSHG